MKNSIIIKRITVCALPFIIIPLLYFAAEFVLKNITVSTCIYYTTVHLYCPGCGFTRAVEALLRGDILLSLRQNILLVIGMIIAAVYYIELLLKAFGVKIDLKPLHSIKTLWGALIFLGVFTVLRNVFPVLAPV